MEKSLLKIDCPACDGDGKIFKGETDELPHWFGQWRARDLNELQLIVNCPECEGTGKAFKLGENKHE